MLQQDQGDGDTGPADVDCQQYPPSRQAIHHDAGHEAERARRATESQASRRIGTNRLGAVVTAS
jgi:hypothetical protein